MQRARTLESLASWRMWASSELTKNSCATRSTTSGHRPVQHGLTFSSYLKSGLLASWNAIDSLQQDGTVGRLIRGGPDVGTGKLFKAFESMGNHIWSMVVNLSRAKPCL